MPVKTIIDSGAGIITMTDSIGGNRLNASLIEGIQSAIQDLSTDDSVRFILLRSNGPVFSLGMDLDAFNSENISDSAVKFHDSVTAYSCLLEEIHKCSKTITALIQGAVKAGGVGLAAACDVVIASDSASFELSELYLGLIPANVMPYILSMRMPVKRAAYLVQTAACIDAQTSLSWGLVDEVHSDYNLEKAVKKLGRRLMRLSPEATGRQKSFMRKLRYLTLEEQRNLAVEELVNIAVSPDTLEAIKGFSNGELPSWFESYRPTVPLCEPFQGDE